MKQNSVMFLARQKAVTLVEIMMAIVIIALALLPAIGTFSRYYGLASRQFNQETALKLSEAVMNQLLAYQYSAFIDDSSFTVPINLQTPEGNVTGNLNFEQPVTSTGKPSTEKTWKRRATSNQIKIGGVTYKFAAEVEKVFFAQDIQKPHNQALEFKYAVASFPNPVVASYSSFDDLIMIKLAVNFGRPKDHFELITFRADMNK